MQRFSISPLEMASSLWRNRILTISLIKREVIGRYRGSFIGIFWALLNPIFMLLVYTFVFSVIFKARWNGESDSKAEFALVLFAGLMVFNMFAECVTRAPSLILANSTYVKKIIFPLDILAWTTVGSAIFHTAVSLLVWTTFYVFIFGFPHMTILLLPLIIIPFMLFTVGFTWLLASLGVFLRDLSQVVAIFTTVLMFLSPIFYPASALPAIYQKLIFLNPLTFPIEQTRNILLWGIAPDISTILVYFIISTVIAWIGFVWFQKTRKGFADVL